MIIRFKEKMCVHQGSESNVSSPNCIACNILRKNVCNTDIGPVADPISETGAPTLEVGVTNVILGKICTKNSIKMKENGPREGLYGHACPLDRPLGINNATTLQKFGSSVKFPESRSGGQVILNVCNTVIRWIL